MRSIVFNNCIDLENITRLIYSLELHKNEKIKLYFSTWGGESALADVLIDYINSRSSDIELVCFGGIQSAGFSILMSTNCEKKILDTCWGMAHKGKFIIYSKFLRIFPNKSVKYKQKLTKAENDKFLKKCKNFGISENKLKDIYEGKDVYFNNDEMKYLFNNKIKKVKINE